MTHYSFKFLALTTMFFAQSMGVDRLLSSEETASIAQQLHADKSPAAKQAQDSLAALGETVEKVIMLAQAPDTELCELERKMDEQHQQALSDLERINTVSEHPRKQRVMLTNAALTTMGGMVGGFFVATLLNNSRTRFIPEIIGGTISMLPKTVTILGGLGFFAYIWYKVRQFIHHACHEKETKLQEKVELTKASLKAQHEYNKQLIQKIESLRRDFVQQFETLKKQIECHDTAIVGIKDEQKIHEQSILSIAPTLKGLESNYRELLERHNRLQHLLEGKVADIGQVLEALKRRLKVETKESGLPEYTYHRGKLDVDICQPDEQAAAMAAELDNVDELHSAIRQDLGNDA